MALLMAICVAALAIALVFSNFLSDVAQDMGYSAQT
jgi:hypothetical protein